MTFSVTVIANFGGATITPASVAAVTAAAVAAAVTTTELVVRVAASKLVVRVAAVVTLLIRVRALSRPVTGLTALVARAVLIHAATLAAVTAVRRLRLHSRLVPSAAAAVVGLFSVRRRLVLLSVTDRRRTLLRRWNVHINFFSRLQLFDTFDQLLARLGVVQRGDVHQRALDARLVIVSIDSHLQSNRVLFHQSVDNHLFIFIWTLVKELLGLGRIATEDGVTLVTENAHPLFGRMI